MERVGWKAEEDELITRSVQELGHKWYQIAEILPGRTGHAIRNRYHRLQTMLNDGTTMPQLPIHSTDGVAPYLEPTLGSRESAAFSMRNPLAV